MEIEKIVELEKKLTELEITSNAALAIALSLLLLLLALIFIKFIVWDMNKD